MFVPSPLASRAVPAVVLAAALFLGGCLGGGAPDGRNLPADSSVPVTYVALGDSTVEGIGASAPERNYVSRLHARLRGRYPNASLLNLGVGGATSADVVAGQLARAIGVQPGLVTLSVGPNDITRRVRVEQYEDNLAKIFGRLGRETSAVVVANLLPDLAVTPRFRAVPERDVVGRETVAFNEALTRQAKKHGVELVDLYTASQAEVPRRPELVWSDGYHPSDAGYARWAELVWPGIERRMAAGRE